jgi:hypothetical protein
MHETDIEGTQQPPSGRFIGRYGRGALELQLITR